MPPILRFTRRSTQVETVYASLKALASRFSISLLTIGASSTCAPSADLSTSVGQVTRTDSDRVVSDARRALFVMAGVIAVLWAVQIVNWLDHYWVSRHFGIVAREPSRLPDIFAAPLLHWSFSHIEANSAPLFFLGFFAAYRGIRRFAVVTVLIVVMSGLGSWLFSPTRTVEVGASGVVFGYFGYVVVRGLVERHVLDVVVGIVVAVSYWSILQGVLPDDPHISWQAHLFGLIGGIVAALLLRQRERSRTPVDQRPGNPAAASTGDPSRAALHKELDDLGLG
jgi:membrane associated rhomboid family serine protease